jgi:rubrerythrin
MKLTKKQLNYYIKDERKAVKEYKKLGLKGLAKQEQSHLNFFKMLKARRK